MDLPPLESGRREHACTLYKDGILVTGSSPEEGFLDSQIRMEFLNLTSMQWENDVVPNLNKHVLTPKMETINGRQNPQTSHNIDCVLVSLCYIRTVFHLNSLTAQLSYEERAAVERAK
jgi:hypothetical protein